MNCIYDAQGQLICQNQPFYIDSTGMFGPRPRTNTFWDSVKPIENNPACLLDMPCCKPDVVQNNDVTKSEDTGTKVIGPISHTGFCKPAACCSKEF